MKKLTSVFVILSLIFFNTAPVFAQLDTPAPVTDPTPEPTTVAEPVVEPEPTPAPVIAPVEEIITPPALPAQAGDTTGPAFISVATASAQENEVTVVWTTDEPAYGFVEYGRNGVSHHF